jgi:hypothetical protein
MTYELAKQLEDLGFNQVLDLGDEYYTDYGMNDGGILPENYYRVPHLSELIEAIGDKFFDLTKEGDKWEARAKDRNKPMGKEDTISLGDTPLEAVAKLYIKLNEK